MNMRVVVGVSGEGSAEFSGVSTYYKLTSWGTTVKDEAWLDWEKASGTTADVTLETDASDRAVITNKGSSSSDTAIAGVSGKFTVNFDYNPELSIRVRGLTGKWRLSVTAFDGGQKYVLGDWSDKKSTVEFNLNEATGGALRGQKNVYLSIEVLGGGKSVTVDRVETYYTAVAPILRRAPYRARRSRPGIRTEPIPPTSSFPTKALPFRKATPTARGCSRPPSRRTRRAIRISSSGWRLFRRTRSGTSTRRSTARPTRLRAGKVAPSSAKRR